MSDSTQFPLFTSSPGLSAITADPSTIPSTRVSSATLSPCPLVTVSLAAPKPPRMCTAARQGSAGMVIVEVGTDRKKYLLNSAFLRHYSKMLFNNRFSSLVGDHETILLPDVTTNIFDIFVDWVYTQQLPAFFELARSPFEASWDCLLMVKCWFFAQQFKATSFEEAVNNAFVTTVFQHGLHPHYETIIHAFGNSKEYEKPLMMLMVDYHCECWQANWDSDNGNVDLYPKIPVKFWVQCMQNFAEVRDSNEDAGLMEVAYYHLHEEDGKEFMCEICNEDE
ncbi:hypothetical protein EJ02DRAFT_380198 [Clathrospora elynae]|uniref:BTB domain-containing protein n=1 Tax=Clathrospora elynae TaxID=706981 RepID=A0A6A5SNK7_9PLEO|nr:hypothetical protein EJ02DRAFT_380198 [Clathrospora elynae]